MPAVNPNATTLKRTRDPIVIVGSSTFGWAEVYPAALGAPILLDIGQRTLGYRDIGVSGYRDIGIVVSRLQMIDDRCTTRYPPIHCPCITACITPTPTAASSTPP